MKNPLKKPGFCEKITFTATGRPNKPSKPYYDKKAEKYCTSTTDPDGDDLYYLFDWDDGSNSGWLGPYASGETACKSHSWSKGGTYYIKVKAKDVNDQESDWSEPLKITPQSKIKSVPHIVLFLQKIIDRFPLLVKILQLIFFEKLLKYKE